MLAKEFNSTTTRKHPFEQALDILLFSRRLVTGLRVAYSSANFVMRLATDLQDYELHTRLQNAVKLCHVFSDQNSSELYDTFAQIWSLIN